MTAQQKAKFVRELTRSIAKSVIEKIPQMPKEWDGIELRWLIAQYAKDSTLNPQATSGGRKRFRDYENERITRNL